MVTVCTVFRGRNEGHRWHCHSLLICTVDAGAGGGYKWGERESGGASEKWVHVEEQLQVGSRCR